MSSVVTSDTLFDGTGADPVANATQAIEDGVLVGAPAPGRKIFATGARGQAAVVGAASARSSTRRWLTTTRAS